LGKIIVPFRFEIFILEVDINLLMSHTPLKRKEDIELSLYELKFRGRYRSREVQMTVWEIGAEEKIGTTIYFAEELQSCKDSDKLIWLNIDGLQNERLLDQLADTLYNPLSCLCPAGCGN
jgi:magnesium transporter